MEKIRDQQAIRAKRLRQLLNGKQKENIKEAFDHFDQRGAGKIRKKELKVILRALGFDPSNEELDKLLALNNNDGSDSIDFQEFMDIMLTKIEEKLSADDIKYTFRKIADVNLTEEELIQRDEIKKKNKGKKKGDKQEYLKKELITHEDIKKITETLGEKLTGEEIDEMIIEAVNAGRLLNKTIDKKKDEKLDNEDDGKITAVPKSINLYEFKAILTWENN
jgi:centrin-1